MGTDEDWETWGRTEPYFGVLTNDSFRSDNLDAHAKSEFYDSGARDIDAVLRRCRRVAGDGFAPATALDFGCGVGRMTAALAQTCTHVIGVDISPSMLAEARKSLDAQGLANVDLRLSDDRLSKVPDQVDLVTTQIVLQHIPTDRGIRIFAELVKRIKPGGVGAIQLTYARARHAANLGVPRYPLLQKLDRLSTTLLQTFSKLIGNSSPSMQMNQYDLNQVFYVLQTQGVRQVNVEYTDHDAHLGMHLTFQKS